MIVIQTRDLLTLKMIYKIGWLTIDEVTDLASFSSYDKCAERLRELAQDKYIKKFNPQNNQRKQAYKITKKGIQKIYPHKAATVKNIINHQKLKDAHTIMVDIIKALLESVSIDDIDTYSDPEIRHSKDYRNVIVHVSKKKKMYLLLTRSNCKSPLKIMANLIADNDLTIYADKYYFDEIVFYRQYLNGGKIEVKTAEITENNIYNKNIEG